MNLRMGAVLFILSIAIYGCGTQPRVDQIPKKQRVFLVDLSEYSKSDFLITPYQYLGDYESIGFVESVNIPSGKANKIKPKGFELSGNYDKIEWIIGIPDSKEMLDSMVSRSVNLGANALIDFRVQDTTYFLSEQVDHHIPSAEFHGLKATGFAIKRLGSFKSTSENKKQ